MQGHVNPAARICESSHDAMVQECAMLVCVCIRLPWNWIMTVHFSECDTAIHWEWVIFETQDHHSHTKEQFLKLYLISSQQITTQWPVSWTRPHIVFLLLMHALCEIVQKCCIDSIYIAYNGGRWLMPIHVKQSWEGVWSALLHPVCTSL